MIYNYDYTIHCNLYWGFSGSILIKLYQPTVTVLTQTHNMNLDVDSHEVGHLLYTSIPIYVL